MAMSHCEKFRMGKYFLPRAHFLERDVGFLNINKINPN